MYNYIGNFFYSKPFLLLFLFLYLNTITAFSETSDAFQTQFDVLKLEEIEKSRAWKKLIHIERNAVGIPHRQISDANFYLSNSKQYEKDSELIATLKAFTEPLSKYEKMMTHPLPAMKGVHVSDHSQHALCRFPARRKFLENQLWEAEAFWSSLPKPSCVYRDIFLQALDAESVSFVFSSYYSDSPGSAFGHTFFRINRKSSSSTQKQELLDYGVGFAANVTVQNPALYALMGLFGGFKGTWTNLPYYYKVREYNDFEARDLWSYDLALSDDEVEMMVLHLWEVGAHYYTYYFFTQNCAYHMLTVLEAAAPRLHLVENVPFYYVIPADSMKSLFYEKGLVESVSYRPSIRKIFLQRYELMDQEAKSKFEKYAREPEALIEYKNLSVEQQAKFIDAAIDLFDLRNPKAAPDIDKKMFSEKEKLLGMRAKIDYISDPVSVKKTADDHPENSHGSSRLGITLTEQNSNATTLVQYRFALHDLQDSTKGLPNNSQLEFFNFNFGFSADNARFEDLKIFKVLNLNPVTFFENKASWGFELGIENKAKYCSRRNGECHLFGITGKYGKAYNFSKDKGIIWGLGRMDLRYGSSLNKSANYIAAGFDLGVLYRFDSEQSIFAQWSREFPIDRDYFELYEIQWRNHFHSELSVGLGYKNDAYSASGFYYF